MTTQAQTTVRTVVYITDLLASPDAALAIPALKGFSPAGGGKRKKNDKSNFDSLGYNENQGGRADPAEASGEIVLMKSLVGHQKLKALFEAQVNGDVGNTSVVVCDSDGTGAATVVAGVLTPPTTASPKHWTRSGVKFDGYISTLQPKYADDDLIRADLAFQVSGASSWFSKGDVSTKFY